MPFRIPVIGDGSQPFNPIHADDLAEVVLECPTKSLPGTGEIGGPDQITLAELTADIRNWLGLPQQPLHHLPLTAARFAGHIGDALRLGPISTTAITQLETGVLTDPTALLAQIKSRLRGVKSSFATRPAGTQDLWHARLYLIILLIRLTLAALWLASGLLGLFTPSSHFTQGIAIPPILATTAARMSALADLGIAVALIRNLAPKPTARLQLALVAACTLGLTLIAPQFWPDPYGTILKNLPVLALILTHLALTEDR